MRMVRKEFEVAGTSMAMAVSAESGTRREQLFLPYWMKAII